MRFPTVFRRYVKERPENAPDAKELGADERPEGRPAKADNFHTSTMVNINGFPAQRLALGLVGPKEALGAPVPVEVWLHEEQTGGWLRVPGDDEVRVGGLAYFDVPCLLSHGRARSEDDSHNPGALDVVIVPRAPAAEADRLPELPAGVYAFVVGTDVSNPGR